jgi:hypothetical protein
MARTQTDCWKYHLAWRWLGPYYREVICQTLVDSGYHDVDCAHWWYKVPKIEETYLPIAVQSYWYYRNGLDGEGRGLVPEDFPESTEEDPVHPDPRFRGGPCAERTASEHFVFDHCLETKGPNNYIRTPRTLRRRLEAAQRRKRSAEH